MQEPQEPQEPHEPVEGVGTPDEQAQETEQKSDRLGRIIGGTTAAVATGLLLLGAHVENEASHDREVSGLESTIADLKDEVDSLEEDRNQRWASEAEERDEQNKHSQETIMDPERNSFLEQVFATTSQRVIDQASRLEFTELGGDDEGSGRGILSGELGSSEVELFVKKDASGNYAVDVVNARLAVTRSRGEETTTFTVSGGTEGDGVWTTHIHDSTINDLERYGGGSTAGPARDEAGSPYLALADDVSGGAKVVDAAVVGGLIEDF